MKQEPTQAPCVPRVARRESPLFIAGRMSNALLYDEPGPASELSASVHLATVTDLNDRDSKDVVND